MAAKSHLSNRGLANAKPSEHMARFFDVIANPYHETENPEGFINLGSSENFIMHDDVVKFVNRNFTLQPSTVTYGQGATGSPRLNTAMAKHINAHFAPVVPVHSTDIVFSAGVTALNEMYAWNLADPGDGILLSRPIYAAFENDFTTKAKIKTQYVDLEGVDAFGVDAVGRYERAIVESREKGVIVRVLLVCNPHNPLGQCYSRDALQAYMILCQKYQIHLISDEIYALSMYDGSDPDALPFTSVLSIPNEGLIDSGLLHVLYGMSKDFGFGGLRLGCLITKNEALKTAMRAISMFHWPSVVSVDMATTILEDQDFVRDFTAKSHTRLTESYKLATSILDQAGIGYHKGSNAGFFVWVDLSSYLPTSTFETEDELMTRFLDAGVYIASGKDFQSARPGWFRIIFAQDQQVLREGLERVIKVLSESKR